MTARIQSLHHGKPSSQGEVVACARLLLLSVVANAGRDAGRVSNYRFNPNFRITD